MSQQIMSDTEEGDFKEIDQSLWYSVSLQSLHLWGRIFGNFPEIKGLVYADDDNIIVTLSTTLKLSSPWHFLGFVGSLSSSEQMSYFS